VSEFKLDFSGDPVPCDFPKCTLSAFHDGDHEFAAKKEIKWSYDRHCVVCGVPFTVLGADKAMIFDTCGSAGCLLHFANRHASTAPLLCRCPQRPYPHELSVHARVRFEKPGTYVTWDGKFETPVEFADPGMVWPWSLRFSRRDEPSTERKAA
jgi:hypothetical protein